ncbi:YqeG family HAD IIIA-type phosphatase [uncultured Neglectibacter sp.]|uniref:YqeG family HAD IIIA-type phosphatase n=1 Tax=uncultured Neglectibacter sp. TaxID=1924108 RepID=UPI0034DFC4B3
MAIFRPTAMKRGLTDLTPEFLSGLGVKALLLDVDNTVASYTSHEPIPGAVEWAHRMVDAGFRVLVVSNNFKKRVQPFAARFGLDCISFAMKPLPFGYLKARRLLRMKCPECAIIGDQIFTDVIGANLCGMKSVLLTPIEEEEGVTFRVRRHFEKGLREKYRNRRDVL